MSDIDHINERTQMGRTIAYYRVLRKMSQETLAEKAHISRTHLSEFESPNGKKSISLTTIYNIAEALQVPAAWLFDKPVHTLPPYEA